MAEPATPRTKGQHRTRLETLDWIGGDRGRFAAFPLGDGVHDPVVVIVEYAPGVVIGPHAHGSDYFSMVLKGDLEVTRRNEDVGSMRHVRATTAYGPLMVGPEGATVLEVFADRQTFVAPQFVGAHAQMDAGPAPMPALFALAIAQARARFSVGPAVEASQRDGG
jgi:hypothetical protein